VRQAMIGIMNSDLVAVDNVGWKTTRLVPPA
jgi:hypothetical protein